MLHLDNFSACVIVDGKELEQYGVDIDGKKATCWIPSEVGKNFSVKWKDSARVRHQLSSGVILLDGQRAGSKGIDPGRLGHKDTVERSYLSVSATSLRLYEFSSLKLTDDDAYLNLAAPHDLGEICLKIWAARKVATTCFKSSRAPEGQLVLHERSKKGTSHCVKFGAEIQRAPKKRTDVTHIGSEPLATFVFRYRPMDVLKANGIVPPANSKKRRATTEPEVENVKQEVNTDGANEAERIDALEAQVQSLLSTVHELRGNRPSSSGTGHKKVKTEPKHVASSMKNEVIDLT